jgi:hypothetical protein
MGNSAKGAGPTGHNSLERVCSWCIAIPRAAHQASGGKAEEGNDAAVEGDD